MKLVTGIIMDFAASFEIMKTGVLKDKDVVSHVFPLEEINKAFEVSIDSKASIKVMIEP